MTVYVVRDFNGPDGDPWPGFVRVDGPALAEELIGNRGGAGISAGERIYRPNAWPGVASYKVAVNLKWDDATTVARELGVGARVTSDGGDGYWMDVRSQIGASPQVRLRRRVGGSYTDLVAWSDLGISAATLEAGADFELHIQNVEGGVSLKTYAAGSEEITHTDNTGAQIGSGGTTGLRLGALCVQDDATFDDFQIEDFAAEAPPAASTGLALILNGEYLSEDDWVARGISVMMARDSYDDAPAVEIQDLERFNEPALVGGMDVKVQYDGVTLASGKLRQTSHSARSTGEGSAYTVNSPAQLAAELPLIDPQTKAGEIGYNHRKDSPLYAPDRADLTIGEIIADILDDHADGDDGGRSNGSMPPDGSPYVQAEIDALDADPRILTVTNSPLVGVEAMLAFMPSFARRIDPDSLVWNFHDRAASPIKTIDLGTKWVEATFGVAPEQNMTYCLVRGSREEEVIIKNDLAAGDLEPDWDASLEASWTKDKMFKNRDVGTVTASGDDGSNVWIESNISMTDNEWNGTPLTFPGLGDSYTVLSNVGNRITLVESAWGPGGQPISPEAFEIGGGSGDAVNGYQKVHRDFKFNDPDKWIIGGQCLNMAIDAPRPDDDGFSQFNTRAEITKGGKGIRTDQPAIGLFNFTADPCEDGGAGSATAPNVTFSGPTFETKSDGTTPVSYMRWPAEGYRGTAYAKDPTKWDGGGVPGFGDYGVTRHLDLQIADFDGSPEDQTRYQKMCNSVLAITGTLARTATITIGEIDTSWSGLNRRVAFEDTANPGRNLEDWMTDGSLWLLAVEWDFQNGSTVLHCGTLSSGEFDLAALRQTYADRGRKDRELSLADQLNKMWECMQESLSRGGFTGQPDPTPICSSQVFSSVTKPGRNVKEDIESLLKLLKGLDSIIRANKGYITWEPNDGNGPLVIEIPDPAGGASTWWVLNDDGTWAPTTPVGPGTHTPRDDDAPFGDPGDLGPGIEQALYALILALAANAGKTIEDLEDIIENGLNGTKPPGTPVPPGGGEGGTGGNVMGTDDGTGGLAITPLPTDGSGVTPGNSTSQDLALKEMLGIDVVTMADPIGWVFSTPSGAVIQGSGGTPAFSASPQFFVAGPSDFATSPYLTSTFRGVKAAAGGPGTGVNGGNYEYTGELVTPVTAMRWRGPWEPLEDGHQRGEVVTDDGFTMVANKPTTERAAPQASGDPFYTIDGETFATVNDNVGVKVTGQRWTISQASNAGWIVDARVHIPDASPTIEYRTAYRINGGQWTLGAPLVVPGIGWFDVSATGSTVVRPGDVLEFGLYASETAAETVYGPHQWNYSSGGGANVPAPGEAYERTSQNTIRFHYNDDGGTDRSGDLTAVVAGSTIEDDAGRSWQVESVLDVPGSSYVEYTVTPTGGPTASGLRTFTFTVPTPAPTPHSEDAGYWTANPPSAGTIEGFVSLDGAAPTYDDTAYGADLQFQPAYVSPDWDLVAHSESTGGGGSSSWRVVAQDDGPVALPTTTPDTIITATVTGLTIGSEYRLALTGTVRASPTSNADYLLTFLIGTEYIFTIDKTPTVSPGSPKTLNRGEKAILMAAAETVDVHFQVASEFGGAGNGTGIRLEVEVTPL